MQGLKKFYVRAQLKDNDVRGITILYDQAMEGIMEPVVVAMSSAFAPFGSGNAMPGLKRQVEYATAIVASPSGHLIADRMATDGCHVIVVPGVGNAERVAEDQASDLALLRVYGVGHLKPMALVGAAAAQRRTDPCRHRAIRKIRTAATPCRPSMPKFAAPRTASWRSTRRRHPAFQARR